MRSPTGGGGAAMTSLRWAFAFYGGFTFISLATIVVTWFTP
jgi:hypothetical protein